MICNQGQAFVATHIMRPITPFHPVPVRKLTIFQLGKINKNHRLQALLLPILTIIV